MHLGFSNNSMESEAKTDFPVPRLLFIRITEACNASCFMCDFAGKKTSYLFTAKDAYVLAQEIEGSSIRHVRLTGGEPLLLKEVDQVVSIFKEIGMMVSIITNGLLLDKRSSDLIAAGLNQIIISLDSPLSEVHNKLRNTEDLFQNALTGMIHIQKEAPTTLIRVNTIVTEHNIMTLPDMFVLLHDLGVDQWSLIPCKPFPKRFSDNFEYTWNSVREQLLNQVSKQDFPHLMGNSLDLFGQNKEDFKWLMKQRRFITPKPQCVTVDWIRFLEPKTQKIFPCNCIPHRGKEAERFGESWNPDSWKIHSLESSRTWLRHYGPNYCTGCEPLNAALGDGFIDLNKDLFGF